MIPLNTPFLPQNSSISSGSLGNFVPVIENNNFLDIFITRFMSCSIKRRVTVCEISRIRSIVSIVSAGDIPEVGSSSKSNFGFVARPSQSPDDVDLHGSILRQVYPRGEEGRYALKYPGFFLEPKTGRRFY